MVGHHEVAASMTLFSRHAPEIEFTTNHPFCLHRNKHPALQRLLLEASAPSGTILNTCSSGSTSLLSSGGIAPGGSSNGDVCLQWPSLHACRFCFRLYLRRIHDACTWNKHSKGPAAGVARNRRMNERDRRSTNARLMSRLVSKNSKASRGTTARPPHT
jgi:hypothetical protein